jgi:hypothetical protein
MRSRWWAGGVIWMGIAMASAANTAAAREDAPASGFLPPVVVEVTDYAHLPAEYLTEVQSLVSASYRPAGIAMIWLPSREWPAEPPNASKPAVAVRVVILTQPMTERKCRLERIRDDAMGIAISGASEAGARIAYIFSDRIQRAALAEGAPVVRGLGHVIAHEIGHLLLGTNGHSDIGLMRPDWCPRETHVQTLTEGQIRQVWRRFAVGG